MSISLPSYTNTLYIVTPSRSSVNGSFMNSINQILQSNINNELQMNITFKLFLGKSNIVHARSIALTQWYDISKDGDLFLFIDSDHVFTAKDIITAVNFKDCDVACGIYCNAQGAPNAYMMNLEAFLDNSRDNRMLYAGTGFMLIHRPICSRMLRLIEKLDGEQRFHIDDNATDVIPFFRTRLVDSENGIHPINKKHWLGEDYSFCWMVRQCQGIIRGFISNSLGHEVLQVRKFIPDNYKGRTWPKGSIVYICGSSLTRFDPTETHHGGSEKAVINLCKRWVNDKRVTGVTVYGNVNKGVYDGVEYIPFDEFNMTDQFDTVVLWRSFGGITLPSIKANKILIDFHDVPNHDLVKPEFIKFKAHRVFVKSMFHRSLLHPSIPDGKICIIPNGIEFDVLQAATSYSSIQRNQARFIYASSYMRGLDKILLYCWPIIRQNIPDAELHCYYGMEIATPEERMKFEKLFKETPGVYDHGRITIKELIQEKQKASFHIYLTNNEYEIDCLTIRESALLGCIPLLTPEGVFKERIGIFHEMTRSKDKNNIEQCEIESYKQIANSIVSMIHRPYYVEDMRKKLQEDALRCEPSWDEIAYEWMKVMEMI